MIRYDTKKLARDIDAKTTKSKMNAATAFAARHYMLNGLVDFVPISPDEESYQYTPEKREMYHGQVSPMTCRSNPTYTSEGPPPEPVKIWTYPHEIALDVCYKDCTKDTLDEILVKKHRQIAMAQGMFDWDMFWYGHAPNGIYGMANHPNAADQQETGYNTPWLGTPWSGLTVEQILLEMEALTYDFRNPIISMSRESYLAAFGKLVAGSECSAIMTCLAKLINSMPDINFSVNNIKVLKLLDGLDPTQPNIPHHQFTTINGIDVTEKNMLVVYDGDAVQYRRSSMQAMGAGVSENTKYAKAIRWHASQGVKIELTDSVRIRYGV